MHSFFVVKYYTGGSNFHPHLGFPYIFEKNRPYYGACATNFPVCKGARGKVA